MATCRAIFSRVSTFVSCRNLLQTGNQLPSYQQCAFLKGKHFEKLGITAPPKMPLVPFFLFKREALSKLKAENPQLTQKELLKLLAAEWEKYPAEKKEILQKESRAAFEKYKNNLADYKKTLSIEQLATIEKAKEKQKLDKELRIRRQKREDLQKPKRPSSPYSIFFTEKMNENTNRTAGRQNNTMRTLAITWKALPDEEKKKYQMEYDKAKAQYRKDLKAWEEKMVAEGNLDVLGSKALKKLHNELKKKNGSRFEDETRS